MTKLVVGEKDCLLYTLYNCTSAIGVIERLHVYDKDANKTELLKALLDYLYTLESPYFKILGLRCSIQESGLNDSNLQCAGFYTNSSFSSFTFYHLHLHPHFEEALNLGTTDEEIKVKFRENYNRYCMNKEKYLNRISQELETAKEALEYFELKGDQKMAHYKRQDIETYEKILNANESKGLSR